MPMQEDFMRDGAFTEIARRLSDLEGFVRRHMTETSSSSAADVAGIIKAYGGAAAPTGYLLCDGTSYLRAAYPDLFTAIGTTFGSADGTHFNVPDFRGRVPVGVGTGTGGGASGTGLPTGGSALTAVPIAGWKGEETHVLSVAELAAHNHNIYLTTGPGGTASVTTLGSAGGMGSHTLDSGTDMQNAGSSSAHNNIQPVMGVNFIIKT